MVLGGEASTIRISYCRAVRNFFSLKSKSDINEIGPKYNTKDRKKPAFPFSGPYGRNDPVFVLLLGLENFTTKNLMILTWNTAKKPVRPDQGGRVY